MEDSDRRDTLLCPFASKLKKGEYKMNDYFDPIADANAHAEWFKEDDDISAICRCALSEDKRTRTEKTKPWSNWIRGDYLKKGGC